MVDTPLTVYAEAALGIVVVGGENIASYAEERNKYTIKPSANTAQMPMIPIKISDVLSGYLHRRIDASGESCNTRKRLPPPPLL